MCGFREPTLVLPAAVFHAGRAIRASMSIYTRRIVAGRTIPTRCHPRDKMQQSSFEACNLLIMNMHACRIIAFTQQVMRIAEFHLFEAVDLQFRQVLEVDVINALAVLVALHNWCHNGPGGSCCCRCCGCHSCS